MNFPSSSNQQSPYMYKNTLSEAKSTREFDFTKKSRHKRYYATLAINVLLYRTTKICCVQYYCDICCLNPALSTEINFHRFDRDIYINEFLWTERIVKKPCNFDRDAKNISWQHGGISRKHLKDELQKIVQY